MYKKILIGGVFGLVLATFVSCGNKDEGRHGAADMNATCYLLQTNALASNPTAGHCYYNYSANPGFQSITTTGYNNNWSLGIGGWDPWRTNYWNGYGSNTTPSCGYSMQMVYSPTKGLGCVNTNQLNMNGQPVYYTFNQTTLTFVQAYIQYYPGGTTSTARVLRVCDDSEPCPSGQHCRSPMGPMPSGAIGICYF